MAIKSHMNNPIWSKIEFVLDFMAVIITCKSEEDSIKNETLSSGQIFLWGRLWGPQSWKILMPIVESGPKSNLSEILCMFL